MDTIKQIKENIDSKFLSENGTLQIISSENYMNVLKENQSKIIEVDRDYIQRFVKIGSYLKSTEKNIFQIFEKTIKDDFNDDGKINVETYAFFPDKFKGGSTDIGVGYYNDYYLQTESDDIIKKHESNPKYKPWTKEQLPSLISQKYNIDVKIVSEEVDKQFEKIKTEFEFKIRKDGSYEPINILKELNQKIVLYHTLVISGFKMLKSIEDDDMITFYELYEMFDKLNIFDTQWQKNMLSNFENLNSTMEQVVDSINEVNSTIKNSMKEINSSIIDMGENLSSELSEGFDWVVMSLEQ